jgi:hypothetical protein
MDFDEMRAAVARAQSHRKRPVILECVDYATIYRSIYESLKQDGLEHKDLHAASLKIADALWGLHLLINGHEPQLEKSADTVVVTTLKLFQ